MREQRKRERLLATKVDLEVAAMNFTRIVTESVLSHNAENTKLNLDDLSADDDAGRIR